MNTESVKRRPLSSKGSKSSSIISIFMVFFLLTLGISISEASKWDGYNNPSPLIEKFVGSMETSILSLPQSGRLERVPWPDSYWPNFKMGIANRFNESKDNPISVIRRNRGGDYVKEKDGFTKEELKKLSKERLNCLSPAEKLDIANCNYHYPIYNRELSSHSSRDPKWTGLCHGWGPSAIEYEEPGTCEITNRDGITIPFSSSDIKGILIYNYAYNNKNFASICGKRNGRMAGIRRFFGIENNDVNAGAFHLILTNMIGLNKKGFVFDRDTGEQVWNQPVYGYDLNITPMNEEISRNAARGTVKEYLVNADIYYINEISAPSPDPQLGGPLHKVNTNPNDHENGFIIKKSYQYVLETDSNGDIIGGHWIGKSKKDHPDILWAQEAPEFNGDFKIVPRIYQESLKNKNN